MSQKQSFLTSLRLSVILGALASPCALAEFEISELLADNSGAVTTDIDGSPSDWIEIHNPGAAASIDGYYLTDDATDLTKWRLPDVTIAANGYLLVFASGKDRALAGSELHTNFSLGAGGEFLALVDPDGQTLVSAFSPQFPDQYRDISYGIGTGGALTTEEPITDTSTIRYFPPTAAVPGWETRTFDDSAWSTATNGVGWGYPDLPGGANGTPFEAEARTGRASADRGSVYIRIPFEIDNAAEVVTMTMEILYEDGFIAYLNGHEVAASNAPANPVYSSIATASIEENDGADFFPFDFAGHLVDGTNVLAFQAMNNNGSSSDFYIQAQLDIQVQDLSAPPQLGFFETPTPGAPNGILSAAPPSKVMFSTTTSAFTNTFQLTLSVDPPGAAIRYTTNGSLPTDDLAAPSPLYTGPITVSNTTQIRAKAFLPGALPGRPRTEGFFKLTPEAAAFTSDLPIVLIDSFGAGAPFETGSTDRRTMLMVIWEPQGEVDPRASMLNPPDLVTRMGARKRGSSSGGWDKYAMSVECWSENDWEENSIKPLNFGSEDDWILSSRYEFDRALMRNDFIYQISRDIGRYAARTRFVELFNCNGGSVSFTPTNAGDNARDAEDYYGVYSLMERLDRDQNRIDIDGLDASITSEPDITGGYIFKNDRADPGEPTLNINWGNGTTRSLVHIYPDGAANPRRPDAFFITPMQKTWLTNHLNEIGVAVNAANGIHPTTGKPFTEYVDVPSFIDHMWLNALMMNVDWGRLSGWMYKPRNAPLVGGPVWDFDRSAGSEDSRDNNPLGWNPSGDSRVWYDGQYPWFGQVLGFRANTDNPSSQLSTRPDQFQQSVDRWYELRKDQFSDQHIGDRIDAMAAEIREAQARNFVRWSVRPPNGGQYAGGVTGWEGEVAHLKGWLRTRAGWIDEQFFTPPTFNQYGGVVAEGFQLTMNSNDATIYYTRDGSDPRAPGGGIAVGAIPFDGGPIDEVLLPEDSACQYFVPLDASLQASWFLPGFDDAGWFSGTSGLGFESAGGALEVDIATDIKDKMVPSANGSNNGSAYFRFEFPFDNAASINRLLLEIKYDDAFVAYLNGTEVARSLRAPASVGWNSVATSGGPSDTAIAGYAFNSIADDSLFDFDISARKSLVINGTNVLALQVMNSSSGGSDFLVKPRLSVNHTVVATPIVLNQTSTVVARAHDGQEWSAPTSSTFVVGAELADASNLVISEIMYNPVGPNAAELGAGFVDGDQFEFLELLNISASPIDLREVSFTSGITFSFLGAAVTELAPGGRALLVSNQAAFVQRYGPGFNALIAGEFANSTNLANSGERLALSGAGGVIRNFSYNDAAPWPTTPDGFGPSLILLAPASNPDHSLAASWGASFAPLGTPGEGDGGTTFSGDPNADLDADGLNAFAEYTFGTSDTDPAAGRSLLAASIAGDGRLTVTFPKNSNASDAQISVELSRDLRGWMAADATLVLDSEVPNGDGTATVTYTAIDPVAPGERLYVRLRATSR